MQPASLEFPVTTYPLSGEEARTSAAPSPSAEAALRVRRMVDDHFALVWRSLRRFGVHESSVDDATQQVFWVVTRKLEQLPVLAERAFLVSTALRVASDMRRVQNRRRDREQDGVFDHIECDSPSAEDLLDKKRARAELDRILDKMPLEARTVFVLSEGEGFTAAQVSELLQIPTGTVASRLRRARELFQAEVARIKLRNNVGGVK